MPGLQLMARTIPERFEDIAVRTKSARRFQSALIFLVMQMDAHPANKQDSYILTILIIEIKRQNMNLQILRTGKRMNAKKHGRKSHSTVTDGS